jgi:hypothetical protein
MVKPNETPDRFVVRVAGLYHRGVICPSEAWNQIATAIDESPVKEFLAQLSTEERQSLLRLYDERPLSLAHLAEKYDSPKEQFLNLLRWCGAGKNLHAE